MERTQLKYYIVDLQDIFDLKAFKTPFPSKKEALIYIEEKLNSQYHKFLILSRETLLQNSIPIVKRLPVLRKLKYDYPIGVVTPKQQKRWRERRRINSERSGGLLLIPHGLGKTNTLEQLIEDSKLRNLDKAFIIPRLPKQKMLFLDMTLREINSKLLWATARCAVLDIKRNTLKEENIILFNTDIPYSIPLTEYFQAYKRVYKKTKDRSVFTKMGYPKDNY